MSAEPHRHERLDSNSLHVAVSMYPYRRPRQHGCIFCFVNLVHVFIACAAAQSLVDSVPRGCALGQVHTSLEVVVSGVLLWFGLHLWLVGPS